MVYFCHQCGRFVQVSVTPDLHCNNCNSDFIEEMDPNDQTVNDTDDTIDDDEHEGAELPNHFFVVRREGPNADDEQEMVVNNGRNSIQDMLMFLNFPQLPGSTTSFRVQTSRPPPHGPSASRSSSANDNTSSSPADNDAGGGGRNTAPDQGPTFGGSGSGGGGGGNGHVVNFINQLMSNLVENATRGPGGVTRVAFHVGGPPRGPGGPVFGNIHGNFNDYAWGPDGVDEIVTRLLNQFESAPAQNVSPADLERLPMAEVTEQQVQNGTQCATCMETFTLKEPVARLDCQHIFHRPCIEPWLKRQNTCPICRKVVDPKTWGDGGARQSQFVDVDELD